MQTLNNPVFPMHENTFQGIAIDVVMDDKPYKIVHADEASTVTVQYKSGGSNSLGLGAGEDVTIPGAVSVTSSASIKLS